jgi:hypothetical protein
MMLLKDKRLPILYKVLCSLPAPSGLHERAQSAGHSSNICANRMARPDVTNWLHVALLIFFGSPQAASHTKRACGMVHLFHGQPSLIHLACGWGSCAKPQANQFI